MGSQFMAVQKRHAKQRCSLDSVNLNSTHIVSPIDFGAIYVEEMNRPISQDSFLSPQPSEAQSGDR